MFVFPYSDEAKAMTEKSQDADLKAIAEAGRAGQRAAHSYMESELRKALDRATTAEQRLETCVEALRSIRQYGSDTLTGRADGPDDRKWQRGAVIEMTRRARIAIATFAPNDKG